MASLGVCKRGNAAIVIAATNCFVWANEFRAVLRIRKYLKQLIHSRLRNDWTSEKYLELIVLRQPSRPQSVSSGTPNLRTPARDN